jgi:hypothetical protein
MLLAACSLADDRQLASLADGLSAKGLDWQRYARLAWANDLAAIAAARLDAVAPGVLPATQAEELRGHVQSSAVLQLVQTDLIARISSLFKAAGIPFLVIKGMALSHQLFASNPHWRSASDIDLLIDPATLEYADEILLAAGFLRRWPDAIAFGRGRGMQLLQANVFDYTAPGNGQLIELHHRLTLNPRWVPDSFEVLHARSVEIMTQRGGFRGLGSVDQVRYLCWHAFAHDGFRLKWIGDIGRALRHADAPNCLALSRGPGDPAQPALALADHLLAIFDPRHYQTVDPVPGAQLHRIGRIVAGIEDPGALPEGRELAGLGRELRYRLFLFGISPGLVGKAFELLRATSDPRDSLVLGLGRRWAWLYVMLGPWLALARFLRRLARPAQQAEQP